MLDTICSLPLTSDLFAQVTHPSEPILAVGLSAGHVQSFKLPAISDSLDPSPSPDDVPTRLSGRRRLSSSASENGLGEIGTAWRTRRHKGSCRSLAYSPDGGVLYSTGTDGLVKAARSEDGRVIGKLAIPSSGGNLDAPSLLHVLTPQSLILSTDSAALYIYDVRDTRPISISPMATQTHRPHDDYVSSLTPLSPSKDSSSGFPKQFLTTGGTTIAITDLRKGVIAKSEDQEEELISSLVVSGLKSSGRSRGEKAVVGGADGVVTLWEKGVWDDQDERITLDASGEAVESLAQVPEETGISGYQGEQKLFAAGLGDGRIRFVRLGPNQVVQEMDVKHDDVEGVVSLSFDVAGRMVSGGGQIVKVWREAAQGIQGNGGSLNKRDGEVMDSDDDNDDGGEEDSSDEEEKPKPKRKKRKRGKGKDRSGGNHVMAFDLD